MLTEADGIPIGIAIAGANRHDVKLAEPTIESIPIKLPKPTEKDKQHLSVDAGYAGVEDLAAEFGYTLHLRPRGEEAKKLKKGLLKKARRWVVERTHSWLNRFRGILTRWIKKGENYLAMLQFACGIITLRACLCG